MKAVIIAGGLGTRLRPLTYTTPKAILPIAGVPLVLRQIEFLRRYGMGEFILCVNHLSSKLKKVLEHEKKPGDKIHYCIEEKALGTGGAVKNAAGLFDSDPLIVMNGDILTDLDLKKAIKFHKDKQAKATIVLVSVEDPTNYGLVITGKSGRVERFIEKPSSEIMTRSTINAGIYILDTSVFDDVPQAQEYSFERELFPKLLEKDERVFGFESKAFWLDVGSPSNYMQAHRAILREEVKFDIPGKKNGEVWSEDKIKMGAQVKIYGPSFIGRGCNFSEGAKVYSMSVIGRDVTIGRNSSVASSIILDGTEIGNDVELKDCIIGYNSKIEDDVRIDGSVVLADESHIKKGSRIGVKF